MGMWHIAVWIAALLCAVSAEEAAQDADPVREDAAFTLHHANAADNAEHEHYAYEPEHRKVDAFDFDPSQGLTFHVEGNKKECFYQDAKTAGDEISGAFVVFSADAHIDLEIKNPHGAMIYQRFGDAEGEYRVEPEEAGVHELCFVNSDSEGKLVTHVTNLLQSQHPVQREHVSTLGKYVSHLDIRLGELESEQHLQQIRTDRFINVEQFTSKRVSFYSLLECGVYLAICVLQVYYIKSLLDNPRSFGF